MQMLAQQLQHSLQNFVNNPLIEEHLQAKLIRMKMRILMGKHIFTRHEKNNKAKMLFSQKHPDKDQFSLLPQEVINKPEKSKNSEGPNSRKSAKSGGDSKKYHKPS
jgi:hypothetical protein